MKKVLFMLPAHREMVKTAMRFKRSQMKDSNNNFNVALFKIKNMGFKGQYSSMDLLYIVQSLRAYSKFMSKKHPTVAKHYRQQADRLEKVRTESFFLNKKEAASAPTLTA